MKKHSLAGALTLVQERRFRVVDDDGRCHLFLLAPDASVEPELLKELAATSERVSIEYREARELSAHVASAIYRTPQ
jgi:hypothetical protein